MKAGLLNSAQKLYTPSSGTTIYIDYSASKQILEVAYTGGKVYQYKGVDSLVWEEYKQVIQSGGSSGKFVNSRIKPVYLDYIQVR